MTNSPDHDLDRRIRALMGAAGDEGPTAPSTLPTSSVRPHVSGPLDRRWWLAIATVAVLAIGGAAFGLANRGAARTTTPATGSTTPVVTDPSTTAPATSVTAATDPITRPYLDPTVCSSGSTSEFVSNDATYRPFAFDYNGTIPLQVLAAPVDGVAKPFAVVLRVPATNRHLINGHEVTVNGAQVSIAVATSGNSAGNGEALWTLPDGTVGYLRSRDLDETAITALVGRLTPRDKTAPIPGFDLAPTGEQGGLVLLHEHLNTGLSGKVEMFECSAGGASYRVRAISGDPVYVYFGILDVRRPYAVGVNGTGAITIEGTPGPDAPTIDQVTNADQNTWDHLGQAPAPTDTDPTQLNGALELTGGPPGAAPTPAAGTIKVISTNNGTVVAVINTNADGSFTATVPSPGTYTLIGTTNAYQNGQSPCTLNNVTIPSPDQSHLLVACIRR